MPATTPSPGLAAEAEGSAPEPGDPSRVAAATGEPDREPADARRPHGRRVLEAVRDAAPALLGYAGIRLLGLAVLWAWADARGENLVRRLGARFDSGWYLGIAERGYDRAIPVGPDGEELTSNLEFFPLYPGLIRLVDAALPVSPPGAALLVSWAAGLVAAWGIYLVGRHVADRRVGILLAVLWACVPHSVVQSMAYTEPIFTAFAAFVLYAVLTRRWLTAGLLCIPAGLTRPTAVTLVAALGVGALIAVVQRRDGWRPWLAAAIAPLGWLGFVAWVGYRLGRVDGYFHVLEVWDTSFDGGRYTVRMFGEVLTSTEFSVVLYVVALVLAVAVVLLAITRHQPWPLVVYSAAILFMSLTAGGHFHSKARLILPAFALLLPVAAGLAAMRTRTRVAVLLLLIAFSTWFGGYLTLLWHRSP